MLLITYLGFDLNYLEYNKSNSIKELIANYDYRPYLRKHGENRFTRFFQEIYLPRKFGIDKRISHLSSLILSGEISKESAKLTLMEPLCNWKATIMLPYP